MDNPALDIQESEQSYKNGKSLTGILESKFVTRSDSEGDQSVSRTSSDIPLNKTSNSLQPATDLLYYIDDVPPWYLTIVLGFQHYLTMAGATVAVPFILCPKMCMLDEDVGRAQIISTIMLVSGIVTIFQSTFGTRLPIVQGGSFSFMIPALAILAIPEWTCPSAADINSMTQEERTELWQMRMREIQGAIILASITEVVLGFFGIVGIVLKYITPMTIAPAIAVMGLSLFKMAADSAALNWGIAALTIVLITLFSQYLRKVKIPVPFTTSPTDSGKCIRYPAFEVFPVLLTIVIAWGVCGILTVTDVLPEGDPARTDFKLKIIERSQWFYVAYPFQWGLPTFSSGAILGMIAGVVTSIVESIGDYYACARIAGAQPPPKHAINRGIFVEGVGCVLAGIFGTGNGTTSYTDNIGAISVTKVASRRVIQVAGIIMIVFSLIGKVGAVFITIPEPILGGVFCIVFSIAVALGLSNLQKVDMNCSRNIFISGFSIFFGLTISQWVTRNEIRVGNDNLDQVINILLGTGMFVAGFIGFFLDNTIPGTPEERGLAQSSHLILDANNEDDVSSVNEDKSYDLPFGMDSIRRNKWLRFLPISPTFQGFQLLSKLPVTVEKQK